MVKRYGKGDPLYKQAQQIWLILGAHAVLRGKSRQRGLREGLLGYGDLAELMDRDRKAGITLARQLGIVGYYCLEHGLPPLNVIVVNRGTGEPGAGVVLSPGGSVRGGQQRVLEYSWLTLRPPSVKSLKDIYYRYYRDVRSPDIA